MKLIATLTIIATVIANSCSSQSDIDIEKVTFLSTTRGGIKEIIITKDSIKFNKNRTEWEELTPEKDWENLKTIIENISVNEIESYQADKNDRFRDAAMHSNLTIVVSGDSYRSQTFDNENAPKQLEELMQYIIKLDEKLNITDNRLFK